MAALIAELDWSATPLGLPESWPQALRTLIDVMLGSSQPMFLAWGPDRTLIYNDAYVEILADKHPAALGRDFLDVWSEIRSDLEPIVEQAQRGEPVHMDDIELWMERKGFREEAHFAFSYTPVRGDGGAVTGFFCACQEITGQIMAERALRESETRARTDAQRVQMALDAGAIIGTWIWDLVVDRFTVDEAFAHAFGLDPARGREGLSLEEITDTVHPDDKPGLNVAIAEAIARGGPYAHQYRVRRTDGRYYWIEANGRVDLAPDGQAQQFSGVLLDVEERREVERARRQSEALLDAVIDAMPVGVIIADADGRVMRDNAANRAIWGMPPETVSWEQYGDWEGYNPETGQRLKAEDWAMSRALRDGETVQAELVENVRFDNGERRFFLNSASPVRDDTGAVIAGVVAEVDVTERLESERRLREVEERYRLAAKATNDAIWDWDLTANTVRWNEAVQTLFGYRLDEIEPTGDWWIDHMHPDDRDEIDASIHAAIDGTATRWSAEYRFLTADGGHRWVLDRGFVIRDASGRALRMIGAMQDLTERRRAEQALVQMNEQLEQRVAHEVANRDQVWNQSLDLMVMVEPDTRLAAVNPAWQNVLGWEFDELIGKPFLDLTHPDDVAETLKQFHQVFEQPLVTPYEFRMRHKDGSWRRIGWTASFREGRVYGTGRDVTAEREQEQALAATEQALRQSQKLETIGQLTGGVAHDFNNLLMAIRSSLNLLERRLPQGDPRMIGLVQNAVKATERGASLTQRMLAFARKQELDARAVDVVGLVNGMRDLIERSIGPEIVVTLRTDRHTPHALVDANQLEMALLNLTLNARDAMEDGRGRLDITVDRAEVKEMHDLAPGAYLRIQVADNGTGMDEQTLSQALEPFFTTKGVGKGTGLGLSMIHGLARQSGGAFQLESAIGQGTTATLFLPVADEETNPLPTDKPSPVASAGKESLRILAVDDDGLVLFGTVALLEDLGHTVLEAASGPDALAILSADPGIDLVITDQAMPKMTGVEMAREIEERWPHIPVILASGYAEIADGEGRHIAARLEKPFTEDMLRAAIAKALDLQHAPAE
ncbi:PAS domain-containing protein [Porphyrobacter sp. GA68]|uniref:PAS domain-containing protein n=1 Tax=Porphyrobacter sp. GA68 TaxID=2883480 RepID=UPI001D18520B|nr:PAS domain-containing protein [Porphyrobacter sp. GA68]